MRKPDLVALTKRELMDLARDKKVAGRSGMDKAALVEALSGGSKATPPPSKPAAEKAPEPATRTARKEPKGRGDSGSAPPRRNERDQRTAPSHNSQEEDDGDRWNRVDAEDPNYGRFLNPAPSGRQRGRSADRAGSAKNSLRRSGEARRGVGYVPIHNQPEEGDGSRRRGRDGERGSRPSRTRNEGGRGEGGRNDRSRNEGGRGEGGRGESGRKDRSRNDRSRNEGGRNEGGRNEGGRNNRSRNATRQDNERQDGGRKNRDSRRVGGRDDRTQNAESRNDRSRRGRNRDRQQGRREGRDTQVRQKDMAAPVEFGAVGPLDPETLKKELAALKASEAAEPKERELSKKHGVDRCRIMARDPYWLHAYWEITDASFQRGHETLSELGSYKRILRVHSIPRATSESDSQPAGFFDVDLEDHSDSWYIHVGIPNRDYKVDVGLIAETGLFYPLAASNRVTTPPDQTSGEVDRAWSVDDPTSEKLYQLSGGSPVAQIKRAETQEVTENTIPTDDPGRSAAGDRTGAGAVEVGDAEAGGAKASAVGESVGAKTDVRVGAAQTGADAPPGAPGDDRNHLAMNAEDRTRASSAIAVSGSADTAAAPTGASFEVLSGPISPATLPVAVGEAETPATFPNSSEFTARALPAPPRSSAPTSPGTLMTGPAPTSPAPTSPQTTLWSTSPSRPGTTPKRAEDDFWFVLHTELIVSGATEPNAKVTIQGVPVRLREDGTFSVRFQLPDGEQTIPVIAISKDDKFEREITPSVSRSTTQSGRDQAEAKTTAPRRRKVTRKKTTRKSARKS